MSNPPCILLRMKKRMVLLLCTLWSISALVHAAEPILIGDLMSYTGYTEGSVTYRNGYELGLEELNAAGGVLGRPLKVIFRDDKGNPEKAVQAAQELIHRDGILLLTGTVYDHVGPAVSTFAKRQRILFLRGYGGTDRQIWPEGHRYSFRMGPTSSCYIGALAEEAAKLPAKRWAVVAPNYEFGRSSVENFKTALCRLRPDVEFVAEYWPATGKLDAGATINAMLHVKPDGIFTALFTADMAKFIREGNKLGLFKDRTVASVLTGQPEELGPLGAEAPEGWISSGYPYEAITTPEHKKFLKAYRAKYGKDPTFSSVIGYSTAQTIVAMLTRSGSIETEKMLTAMQGLQVQTPVGPILYRAVDGQSTLSGFVGRIGFVNGKPSLVNWRYVDPTPFFPTDDQIRKLRKH